ncbi:MAG: MAPEG family protein [Janthinobacterium lividum]
MTTALIYLGWTLPLVIVQIIVASAAKRRQDGMQWASGNRDTTLSAYTGLAGRMERAQANLLETLPIFIGAVLLSHITGRDLGVAAWGAGIYFWARLLYIPTYALGLVPWRSIVWGIAMIGLVLVLISLI